MSKNKRMRLPNGFGQISEIKNARLRKPFRAMITVGKTETGRPICRLLKPEAYFRTYNEAYAALLEHNKNPFEPMQNITADQLFAKWFEEKSETLSSKSVADDIKRTWKYCSAVYDMPIREVKAWHIKDCMENGTAEIWGKYQSTSPITQRKIKTVFNQLFDYALQYDLVDKNHARNLKLPSNITKTIEDNRKTHISYSDEEMKVLWQHSDNVFVQMILVQCYSGWRPQELVELKISDIDLENGTMTGGMKTDAGKDRIVPIHSAIRVFIQENYDKAVNIKSKNLFNCIDKKNGGTVQVGYRRYAEELSNIIAELKLNPDHKAHDARKQFVTLAKKYNVDEYAIKRIVGHTIKDITEKVYTDRDVNWLKSEIEKIKVIV